MGIITRADECKINLEENLKHAIQNLTELINNDTWGSEEYTDEFIDASETLLIDLVGARQKWKR